MSNISSSIPEFNGELDLSFAKNGEFIAPLPPNVKSMRILGFTEDEEHIYIVGYLDYEPSKNDYVCCRLSKDGKFETDFGDQGYARGNFSDEGITINGVARQAIIQYIDGNKKILLIGDTHSQQPALVRLNSDGSLDKSYGIDGKIIIELPSLTIGTQQPDSTADVSQAVALEDTNVIFLESTTEGAYVIRVNTNGSLDDTFNGSGYRLFKRSEEGIFLFAISETTDGKYLLGGTRSNPERPNSGLIIRLLANGENDPEYGVNGVVEIEDTSIQKKDYAFTALAPQHNNRTAAFGRAEESTTSGLITSIEPDGSRNIQFNRAEPLVTQVDHNHTKWLSGRMLPNGQLQVLGQADDLPNSDKNLVIVQLNANGTIDNTYGRNGVVRFAGTSETLMKFDGNRVLFTRLENQQALMCGLVP